MDPRNPLGRMERIARDPRVARLALTYVRARAGEPRRVLEVDLRDGRTERFELQDGSSYIDLLDRVTALLSPKTRARGATLLLLWVAFAIPGVAGQVPSDVKKRLKSGREDVRAEAIDDAAKAGAAAIPLLLPIAADDKDGRVRDAAFGALGRMEGAEAVALVKRGLTAKSAAERRVAAEVLGVMRAEGVGDALSSLLSDRDPDVVLAAAAAGGFCEAVECRDGLRGLIEDEDQPALLRAVAIESFGRIGGDDVATLLREWIASDDPVKRTSALAQLRFHDRFGVPAVAAEVFADPTVSGAAEPGPLLYQAIEESRAARGAEPIPGLIALLEHPRSRVRHEAWVALRDLTAMAFDADPARWREWWDHFGDGFRVDKKGEGGDGVAASTGSAVAFLGAPIESDRVVFVIDYSGSMRDPDGDGKAKIDLARDALATVLESFEEDAMFNVIAFGDAPRRFRDGLVAATKKTVQDAIKFTKGAGPKGRTNVFDALEQALEDPLADTVVLLSDGAPSTGRFEHYSRIRYHLRQMNKIRNAAVSVVALQTGDRSREFLKQLAEESGGTYVER